jgi:hypothetical protein
MQMSLFDPIQTSDLLAEMTLLEQEVYTILKQHRGRDTAIAMESLANLCRVTTREIQEIVSRLVIVYRIPVGSSSSSARPGFYLIADRAEAQEVYESLKGRALAILKRASVIGRIRRQDLLHEIATELALDE